MDFAAPIKLASVCGSLIKTSVSWQKLFCKISSLTTMLAVKKESVLKCMATGSNSYLLYISILNQTESTASLYDSA